jgi:alkyl hydroperoxide reductase subunit AhpC
VSIKVGEPAPPVSVDAYVRGEDDPVPLDIGGRGDSWTVLLFYPGDFTFVCPTELCAFLELEEEFDAEDARLVAASTDSWHVHRAWLQTSVLNPDDGAALRGTFIIDPDGIVRHASVSDPSVGRSPEEALRILKALRTGELCPVSWQPGQPTLRIAA